MRCRQEPRTAILPPGEKCGLGACQTQDESTAALGKRSIFPVHFVAIIFGTRSSLEMFIIPVSLMLVPVGETKRCET